ncbi:MAG: beta-ketoacyl-ACP synthase III [Niabella sp.]
MQDKNVFITGTSTFLPNTPVPNGDMEKYLGLVSGKSSRVRNIVLRQNGIRQRYYALDTQQRITHTNAEMAAAAITRLLDKKPVVQPDTLLCATSNPDQLIPSHSSMVHGVLKNMPMEIYCFAGVCLTSLQALKTGFMAVRSGESTTAVCCASELASAGLLSKHFEIEYEHTTTVGTDPYMAFEKDFLRFMLSDGAGAVLLQNQRHPGQPALRLDWVDMDSYANELPTCMFYGAELREDGNLKGWKEFSTDELMQRAVLTLKQDIRLLKVYIIEYWIKHIQKCLSKHDVRTDSVTYVIPHVSSMFFYHQLDEGLRQAGIGLTKEKWFTNLTEVGNIGSAAIFVALDALFHSGKLRKGDTILLLVPESGRFSYGTAHLTVV